MTAPAVTDPSSALIRLLGIMRRLRSPDGGCPWDLEQTFETIAPYTIEEAYEVREAVQSGDRAALKDELGDLLFQVVFHTQMAFEEGAFGFGDVAEAISAKIIRRHPHVYADADADAARAKFNHRATRAGVAVTCGDLAQGVERGEEFGEGERRGDDAGRRAASRAELDAFEAVERR